MITNCNDPVFFEAGDISNIQIIGIGFIGDGRVRERGDAAPKKVTFKNNLINTTAESGILGSDYSDWKIFGNTIIASDTAIYLDGAQNVTIEKNDLRATVGVRLFQFDAVLPATGNKVVDNSITATAIGIEMADGATKNVIARNAICLPEIAGINFAAGSEYFRNRVYRNKVFSSGTSCCFKLIAIDADPTQVINNNKIAANRLTIKACTQFPMCHRHKKIK